MTGRSMTASRRLQTLLLASALLLGGCSGLRPASEEQLSGAGNAASWQSHRQQTAAIDGWQISGKLGFRAAQESGSGTLFWLQRRDYYDIRLAGPIGAGAVHLTGHEGDITLEVSGQGRYQAASPEALLEQQLGWQLPVSHLLWWVRGLPAPDSPSQLELDASSRLARLQQDGWQVECSDYRQQDGYWLPQRLKLHSPQIDLTLVIKEWLPRQLGR